MLTTAIALMAQAPTEMPNGKTFNIQSAMNYGKNQGGYWDIPGKPSHIKEGLNIQVWNIDNGHDRNFTLWKTSNGYYEIQIGNTTLSRVDIQGGKKDNGTSVKVWKKTTPITSSLNLYTLVTAVSKYTTAIAEKPYAWLGARMLTEPMCIFGTTIMAHGWNGT